MLKYTRISTSNNALKYYTTPRNDSERRSGDSHYKTFQQNMKSERQQTLTKWITDDQVV